MKSLHSFLLLASCVVIGLAGEPQKHAKIGLVGYKEYLGLLGQELSGNIFIFRHDGHLLAAMSRHQFEDGKVPSQAEDVEGPPVVT